MNTCRTFFLAALAFLAGACDDAATGGTEEPAPAAPQPTVYPNASLVYYGADDEELPSCLFELTLYTDMELDATGNPVGPGQILRVSFNAPLFAPDAEAYPLPEGRYRSASSASDFTPGTLNFGYMNRLDLPTGAVNIPAGSFYGDIPEGATDFDADLLTDGYCEVSRDEEGRYTVTGILVGDRSTKRRFIYTGELLTIDRSDPAVTVEDTTLDGDLTLTTLTQAKLEDKGDSFFLQDESYRTFLLHLAEATVDLSQSWPRGDGRLLRLELFVPWTADARDGIPEGTYRVVSRQNGGIPRELVVPGNMPAGQSGKYTYPSGCWYQQLSDGLMQGYACIAGGAMIVTRTGDLSRLEIDLLDGQDGSAHHIRCHWSGTLPPLDTPAGR